jgi:hypothetical protein
MRATTMSLINPETRLSDVAADMTRAAEAMLLRLDISSL